MNLHIFNPEHDISLAMNKRHVTIPHAAQELRMNLGFLPAFWAENNDWVLVDDINYAIKSVSSYKKYISEVLFVDKESLRGTRFDAIIPWGWDSRIKAELNEYGVCIDNLPTDEFLSDVRQLSHRGLTTEILKHIRHGIEEYSCGESFCCKSFSEVETFVSEFTNIVIKAPWSSSGRGVMYFSANDSMQKNFRINKIIEQQGSVMVEPYYNRIADLAMEFIANEAGTVQYKGLSLFRTLRGKYAGSIIASEEYKYSQIKKYIDTDILDYLSKSYEKYFTKLIGSKYVGAFGVDMMIVGTNNSRGFLIHPCVELNLRNTMGHLALNIATRLTDYAYLMSIEHDVNYRCKFSRIEGKYVRVL